MGGIVEFAMKAVSTLVNPIGSLLDKAGLDPFHIAQSQGVDPLGLLSQDKTIASVTDSASAPATDPNLVMPVADAAEIARVRRRRALLAMQEGTGRANTMLSQTGSDNVFGG